MALVVKAHVLSNCMYFELVPGKPGMLCRNWKFERPNYREWKVCNHVWNSCLQRERMPVSYLVNWHWLRTHSNIIFIRYLVLTILGTLLANSTAVCWAWLIQLIVRPRTNFFWWLCGFSCPWKSTIRPIPLSWCSDHRLYCSLTREFEHDQVTSLDS